MPMSLLALADPRPLAPRRRRVLRPQFGPVLALLLILAMTACVAPAEPAHPSAGAGTKYSAVLIYEAIPSVEVDAPALAAAEWNAREALAATLLAEVVPGVLAAVGIDAGEARSALTQGGWRGRSSVSLRTHLPADDDQADRAAAALGYVLRQYAVLVLDPEPAPAKGVPLVRVGLSKGRFGPALAHAFFAHAGTVADGLATGYTAVDEELWFINVRAADGSPVSGLTDAAFEAALRKAAAGFTEATVRIVGTRMIEARLVSDDWAAPPEAARYRARLAQLGAEAWAALDAARSKHTRIVRAAEAALAGRESPTGSLIDD